MTHQLATLRSRLEQLAGDLQPPVHSWSGEALAAFVVLKLRREAAAADQATMIGAITSALGRHDRGLQGHREPDRRRLRPTDRDHIS